MATDWRTFIASLEPQADFKPPARSEVLERIESTLKIELPSDLRSLLEQSDGVEGSYGLGLVWPCRRILEDNLRFRVSPDFRRLYMPFDPLLFFGDAGNGDQFSYTICGGKIRPDIFVWNHEDDSRSWKAPDLHRYLEWTLSGQLTV